MIFYFSKVIASNGFINIKCHHDDQSFRQNAYAAVLLLLECGKKIVPLNEFKQLFAEKYMEVLDDHMISTMKHAIEVIIA